MQTTLLLRITMLAPPAGVDYGIQEGSGSAYSTIARQRGTGQDLVFDFQIRTGENKDGQPRLLGPVVQGPSGARFIYIDIGTFAGQKDSVWDRRLKIPLTGITQSMIRQVQSNTGLLLATTVPGKAKDQGPNCGMVKPFTGWRVAKK
jgi:hypothetical protein